MNTPISYINGQFVPESKLAIPVHDTGFLLGATVAEQLRTFGGKLFRVQEHFARLQNSLQIVGVDSGLSESDFDEIGQRLIEHNLAQQESGDDLALTLFVTPGPHPSMAPGAVSAPLVAAHTRPIPFVHWANLYEQGEVLAITDTIQVPEQCWPTELKCRSRMHYYLADRQARQMDPLARALLLDRDGFVCEVSTSNVFAFFENEGIITPKREKILPGISMSATLSLATAMGIPVSQRDLRPDELASADEVLLSSTSPCLLPVARIGEHSIGEECPGPIFTRLISAWNKEVGLDIVAQAVRFRER